MKKTVEISSDPCSCCLVSADRCMFIEMVLSAVESDGVEILTWFELPESNRQMSQCDSTDAYYYHGPSQYDPLEVLWDGRLDRAA